MIVCVCESVHLDYVCSCGQNVNDCKRVLVSLFLCGHGEDTDVWP